MIWNIRKQKTIKTVRRKRIQKNDGASSPWDNFKHTNIHIVRVLEGEERQQEIGNLCEKMTENLPNLVKVNRHTHPGSTESQTRWTQRGLSQDTS